MNPSISTEFPRSLRTVSEYRQERARKTEEMPKVIASTHAPSAAMSSDGMGLIQDALNFFDTESHVGAPTSFVPDQQLTQTHGSALAEFMSKAQEIESVFEFGQNIDSSANQAPRPKLLGEHLSRITREHMGARADQAPSPSSNATANPISPESFEPCPKNTKRTIDQASVLKDPQESSGSFTSTIERDEHGRVVRALYIGGEYCRFVYDNRGEVSELFYAGLHWKRDADGWFAQDRQTDYRVDGQITILSDGCIRIEKDDVIRTLKHSGTRIDEHRSGSRTESRKLKNLPSPYDLLAKAKPVHSVWLNSRSSKESKKTGERLVLHSPMPMDVINGIPVNFLESAPNSMIPDIADVANLMDTGNFPPLTLPTMERAERPDRLRELEDQLAVAEHDSDSSVRTLRLDITEAYLKSCLWIVDRIKGQSSPAHLAHLDRLADIYFSRQRNDLAELTHLRALHIREHFHGAKQPELCPNISGLARIYDSRGNFVRAEEMYREAAALHERGLRKILFLYSERVIDANRLCKQVEPIFASFAELVNFLVTQRKMKEAAAVQNRATQLFNEITGESAGLHSILGSVIEPHLLTIQELVRTKSAG